MSRPSRVWTLAKSFSSGSQAQVERIAVHPCSKPTDLESSISEISTTSPSTTKIIPKPSVPVPKISVRYLASEDFDPRSPRPAFLEPCPLATPAPTALVTIAPCELQLHLAEPMPNFNLKPGISVRKCVARYIILSLFIVAFYLASTVAWAHRLTDAGSIACGAFLAISRVMGTGTVIRHAFSGVMEQRPITTTLYWTLNYMIFFAFSTLYAFHVRSQHQSMYLLYGLFLRAAEGVGTLPTWSYYLYHRRRADKGWTGLTMFVSTAFFFGLQIYNNYREYMHLEKVRIIWIVVVPVVIVPIWEVLVKKKHIRHNLGFALIYVGGIILSISLLSQLVLAINVDYRSVMLLSTLLSLRLWLLNFLAQRIQTKNHAYIYKVPVFLSGSFISTLMVVRDLEPGYIRIASYVLLQEACSILYRSGYVVFVYQFLVSRFRKERLPNQYESSKFVLDRFIYLIIDGVTELIAVAAISLSLVVLGQMPFQPLRLSSMPVQDQLNVLGMISVLKLTLKILGFFFVYHKHLSACRASGTSQVPSLGSISFYSFQRVVENKAEFRTILLICASVSIFIVLDDFTSGNGFM